MRIVHGILFKDGVLLRVEKEQQPAPDFALPAIGNDDVVKNGQVHLQDLKGRTTVLYFYPEDDWTPVKIGVYVISMRG